MQPLYWDAINPFTALPAALPAGVVAVAPGALDRIFALVADIKVSTDWRRLRETRNSPRQKPRTRYTRPMRPKSTQDNQPDRENAPFSESAVI